MDKMRLNERFADKLIEKVPLRSELLSIISKLLCIEKESAARRLSGRAPFSLYEVGVLAKKFGISLDALLYNENQCHWFPLILESPLGEKSMDTLYDITYTHIAEMTEASKSGAVECGAILNSFPIEHYVHHPYLMKFMFFKWGYYFVGSDEFNDFSKWKLPDHLNSLKDKLEDVFVKVEHILYIWDEALIWTLVNEVNYFYNMDIINDQDIANIKKDLTQALINLEKYVSGLLVPEKAAKQLSFYVSNINLGISCHYIFSEEMRAYNFKTNFTFISSSCSHYGSAQEVRRWVNSFKNISSLISGSGPLDRKRFFLKQHKIINDYLKVRK